MNAYLRALRPERWPRSLAIFAGTAAFYFLFRESRFALSAGQVLVRGAAAYLLTWAISTANYIINEIVDAPFDVHHPSKKNRPLIKREVRLVPFMSIGLLLTLFSLLAASIFFSRAFLLSLLSLLLAGFVYNVRPLRAKDIPFLDSISESANNPIRFFIGWFAFAPTSLFPPLSLLLSWWSFGNFLLVAKRLSEFRFLKEKAGDYRASLRRYSQKSLLLGMALSAAVFFASYIHFAIGHGLVSYLFLIPLILFYFLLIYFKTLQEKAVMEEPERLLKNPFFAVYTLVLAVLFFIVSYLAAVGR